jgi:hypothetical protein
MPNRLLFVPRSSSLKPYTPTPRPSPNSRSASHAMLVEQLADALNRRPSATPILQAFLSELLADDGTANDRGPHAAVREATSLRQD